MKTCKKTVLKTILLFGNIKIDVFDNGQINTLDHKELRSNGRIDNRKGKIIKPTLDKCGYLRCTFSYKGQRKSYYVHQLVATAFIPNPGNKPTVNHINGVKTDNNVGNLEWATNSEQKIHSIKHNLCEKNIQALKDCNRRKSIAVFFNDIKYSSLNDARKKTGYHSATIKKYGTLEVMQNE